MRVDCFDFDLPETAIALRPAMPRESGRLLEVVPALDPGLQDRRIGDLPDLLRPGDALVVNDTRVVPARLSGERRRGEVVAKIDVTLHKRHDEACWRAFVRPAKKLVVGDRVTFRDGTDVALQGIVLEKDAGDVTFRFDRSGSALDAAIEAIGRPPLPPYIESRRPTDAADAADYQTVFAAVPGAVAAPTAGLHFTPQMLDRIAERGIAVHRVTLHVGAGTFLPVKSETTEGHVMHAEEGRISPDVAGALNHIRSNGGRIIACGTTSARLLESAAGPDGVLQQFSGDTSIFITPGYRFRSVDGLVTNFHLPRSTLFMLVSAFSGLRTMRAAYAHAIAAGYRFYSYGDACLLWRQDFTAAAS